jgi:uncharacterized protein
MGCVGAPGDREPARRTVAAGTVAVRWRACAFLLAGLLATGVMAAPTFPALTGRIVDQAAILSAADRAEIEETLRALDARASDQVVVVTVRSLQGYAIEDYGYQLGRHWQIGQAGTNNGVLLIIAPTDRKVRIEVGRGLEPQLTDTMSKLIIDNAILPAFRRGDFPGGIKAGVRDIKDVLLGDAEAVAKRANSLRKRSWPEGDVAPLVLFALWVAILVFMTWKQRQQTGALPANARARRRQGDGNVIVVPGGWGGSGGWSGGSSGSGGGFSGGGGDFGGGGSSGSW